MKVGILTLSLVSNNGGILQAFALQKFLQNNGFEAILLNRRYKPSSLYFIKKYILQKVFGRKYLSEADFQLLNSNPYNFIQKYIQPQSERLTSTNALAKFIDQNNIDTVIVGSDQVWRLEYTSFIKYDFFLDFKTKHSIKRMSYAASFGLDSWSHDKKITKKISYLLRQFQSISVREESGINLCRDFFKISATQHIDPTLLLHKEDYINLIDIELKSENSGELFFYFLDTSEEKISFTKECAKILNMRTFTVENEKISSTDNVWIEKQYCVTTWLKGFLDAKYVLTDSFHGCVFSIIFNKPFLVIGNINRGLTRFNSLLKLLDLHDRLILNLNSIDKDQVNKPIDYKRVISIVDSERERSKDYLLKVLNKSD